MNSPNTPSGWTPPNVEHAPPKEREPVLHRAARLGDEDAIRRLIGEDADPDALFDIGLDPDAYPRAATPLMVAAGSGDGASVSTVRLLLKLGADPKLRVDGVSAAGYACTGLGWNYCPGGDAERLSYLLECGSPLEISGELGNRILCEAAHAGDIDRLRILLERGGSADGYWNQEQSRQDYESMFGGIDATSILPDDVPDNVRALLTESLGDFNDEMAESWSSGPSSYKIPLFRAAESGSTKCIRALIEAGADPAKRDNASQTAIYYALSNPVIEELLRHGLTLEDQDTYEWSPLTAAAGDGIEALPRLQALIAAGADVNATHDQGFTVLMSAAGAMERDRRILEVLVKAGADPHAVTDIGWNVIHAAVEVNDEANEEQSVRSILGYLCELGADLEYKNEAGYTPLGWAIEAGTGIETQVLAELGADPNAVCPRRACGEEECEAIKCPLIFSAIASPVDSPEKVTALLNAGVDLSVVDEEGGSPIEHARTRLAELEEQEPDEYTKKWISETRRVVEVLS